MHETVLQAAIVDLSADTMSARISFAIGVDIWGLVLVINVEERTTVKIVEWHLFANSVISKSWCSECRTILYCDGCEHTCCTECRTVKNCDVCVLPFCTECDRVDFCRYCRKDHCRECREKWCHLQRKNTRSVSSRYVKRTSVRKVLDCKK